MLIHFGLLDFGRVFEGYQIFQNSVHPHLVPGGVIYAQNLLHQLRLSLEGNKSTKKPPAVLALEA
jgi:hypothetical protein